MLCIFLESKTLKVNGVNPACVGNRVSQHRLGWEGLSLSGVLAQISVAGWSTCNWHIAQFHLFKTGIPVVVP